MDKKKKAALLLFPNLLGDHRHHEPFLPASVDKAVNSIDGLIAESEQAGRRYLSRFLPEDNVRNIPIAQYNEHTPDSDIDFLLEPLTLGQRWGFVSDSGLPCIADPGAKLVKRARSLGIPVQAFVGPSSLLMALMISGLSGQKFYFHGYLSKDLPTREKEIRKMEKLSKEEGRTEIFIETPYRNQHLLETLVNTLHPDCNLAVAWELTMPDQGILSQPVSTWKKSPLPNLAKKNAIFLFQAT